MQKFVNLLSNDMQQHCLQKNQKNELSEDVIAILVLSFRILEDLMRKEHMFTSYESLAKILKELPDVKYEVLNFFVLIYPVDIHSFICFSKIRVIHSV